MALTRDQILAAPDVEVRPVEVPEWGGTVYVRTLSGAQAEAYHAMIREGETASNVRAKLVACAACDEQGNPLFSADDVEALGTRSFRALDRVFEAALELNALGAAGAEAEEKNSETTPPSDSGID